MRSIVFLQDEPTALIVVPTFFYDISYGSHFPNTKCFVTGFWDTNSPSCRLDNFDCTEEFGDIYLQS